MSWVGIHGKGRITLVLPTYSKNEELTQMALACVESYKPQVDEIIISEDADIYREELHKIADRYVLHPNVGYSKNTNIAWRLATGDFALVVNSDTFLAEGDLGDLCIENTITSPLMIEPTHAGQISGACFCVPRNIYLNGLFDENYNFRDADTALFASYAAIKAQFEVIHTIKVNHIAGSPGPSRRAAGAY